MDWSNEQAHIKCWYKRCEAATLLCCCGLGPWNTSEERLIANPKFLWLITVILQRLHLESREGSLNQKQAQLCTLSNQSQLILTLITFSCFGINKINRCTRGEQWDDYKQTSLGQPEDPASSSGARSAFALEDQSLMVHYWCPVLFIVKFQRYKVIEE